MRSTTGAAGNRHRSASTIACARCASSIRRTPWPGRRASRGVPARAENKIAAYRGSRTVRREVDAVGGLLLAEPLEHEPHFLRGGTPERATGRGVELTDLLAHLVHRLVGLLLRGDIGSLGADLRGLACRGVRALDPAADLVPVLVEERDDRNRLIAVVEIRVAKIGFLVAEEDSKLAARDRLADVGEQRRIA